MVEITITPEFVKGDSLEQVKAKIKEFEEAVKKEYFLQLSRRLLDPAIAEIAVREIVAVLAVMQAEYLSGPIGAEDPAKLAGSAQVAAVRQEVYSNFAKAAKSLSPENFTFSLTLLSDEFMGYGSSNEATGPGIPWLYYFLEGSSFDSNLLWINRETYEIIKGVEAGDLGRFGDGYLWTCDEAEMQLITAKLKAAGSSKTAESLRHPQSGKAGYNWFGDVVKAIDFHELVQKPAYMEAIRVAEMKLR